MFLTSKLNWKYKNIPSESKLYPNKVEDGYAKFSCDNPSVNLTLNKVSNPIYQDAINHLGIEVEDTKAVTAAKDRLEQLGLATKLEEDVFSPFHSYKSPFIDGWLTLLSVHFFG